jgi:hypothetical protein
MKFAWNARFRGHDKVPASTDCKRAAFGRNRHREERSDVAIQESQGALSSPGLLRFARNDAAGSTKRNML